MIIKCCHSLLPPSAVHEQNSKLMKTQSEKPKHHTSCIPYSRTVSPAEVFPRSTTTTIRNTHCDVTSNKITLPHQIWIKQFDSSSYKARFLECDIFQRKHRLNGDLFVVFFFFHYHSTVCDAILLNSQKWTYVIVLELDYLTRWVDKIAYWVEPRVQQRIQKKKPNKAPVQCHHIAVDHP